MTEAQAVKKLRSSTKTFLKDHVVTPYAAGTTAQVHTYYMVDTGATYKRGGRRVGRLRKHTVQRFRITPTRPAGTATPASFRAFHLPVKPSNNWGQPFPLVGAHLMITTQLTGCCIALVPMHSGGVAAAHLRPIGETGAELRDRLKGDGWQVFGRQDYAHSRAAVVGVKWGGRWRLYAQLQAYDMKSVTSVKEIELL